MPFVAKAIGHPIAKYASLLMSGKTLNEIGFTKEVEVNHVSVKEAVLPFEKFPGTDTLLGPEMKSTGEVIGIDINLSIAYAKAQIAAGQRLPLYGTVFISMNDKNKENIVKIAKEVSNLNYIIVATSGHFFKYLIFNFKKIGTCKYLKKRKISCEKIKKIHEGRPNVADLMKKGGIDLVMITSSGDEKDIRDGRDLRRMAVLMKIPVVTTVAGAKATCEALRALRSGKMSQMPIQDYFEIKQ